MRSPLRVETLRSGVGTPREKQDRVYQEVNTAGHMGQKSEAPFQGHATSWRDCRTRERQGILQSGFVGFLRPEEVDKPQ